MKLAWRLLMREWRGGELRLIVSALLLAVAAITTVSFFTNRVHLALSTQASQLLAADLIVRADHPLEAQFATQARALGLQTADTAAFPSMVIAGERSQFVEVKAVSAAYPLRGELRVSAALYAQDQLAASGPAPGTAWADERLAQALQLKPGDEIALGRAHLRLTYILTKEPDRAGDFFNIAPRLMLNQQDLGRTQLIQAGSRVSYRLLVAGSAAKIKEFRTWAESRLTRGERLEGVSDARPEIRFALERAERYLGLAALVSAILASVAIALASRQFMLRHLDSCAVLRCLGASQAQILRIYLLQFLILGLLASVAGAGLGYAGQTLLGEFLRGRIVNDLPAANALPFFEGVAIGLILLFAFALPPLMRLKHVSAARVLRRDLGPARGASLLAYLIGALLVIAVLIYRAGEIKLGVYVLLGLLGVTFLGAVLGAILLSLLAAWRRVARGVWFYGLANAARRRSASLLQILGFAIGLTALLLLTLVRSDLLASWQASLPPDAPNRFLINIQPDQVEPLRRFFAAQNLTAPTFYPMIRGRLIAINDRAIRAQDYPDQRAQRLVEREFNLSWAADPRSDNILVAGKWWQSNDPPTQFSVEDGLAQTLKLHLGDKLTYDIAGNSVSGTITSLRKVEWDSMRVNFFVIAPPALLRAQPASYITSFYLPADKQIILSQLLQQFPNFTVIDVAAIMNDVRGIMDRVAQAMTFVFSFALAAGLLVMYAAVASTRDERLYEAAIMRTLGARTRQLRLAQVLEFISLGTIAGILAASGASATAYLLARFLLHLPYHFDVTVWVLGMTGGALGITAAGLVAMRNVVRLPPATVLRKFA